MNQQNKRATTSTHDDPPVKRRRGRPRKDENLAQKEIAQSPAPPGPPSDDVKRSQNVEVDLGDNFGDDMVGQVVSGVIEGSFDAGYFLCVRAGNTDTLMRGVVFHPGLYSPITAANDIAPQAKRYIRKDISIPVSNPQSRVNGSMTQSEHNNEQPVELKKHAPTVPKPALLSDLQSSAPFMPQQKFESGSLFEHVDQPASLMVPTTTTSPKNDAGASLKNVPQQNYTLGLENRCAPQQQSGGLFPPKQVGSDAVTNNLPKNDSGALLGPQILPHKVFDSGCENQPSTGSPLAVTNQPGSTMVPLANSILLNNESVGSFEGKNTPQLKCEFEPEKHSSPQYEHNRIIGHDKMMQEFEASTLSGAPKTGEEVNDDTMTEMISERASRNEAIDQVTRVQPQVVDCALEPSELSYNKPKSPNLFDRVNTPENLFYSQSGVPQTIQPKLVENPPREGTNASTFSDAAGKSTGVAHSPPMITKPRTFEESEFENTEVGFQSATKTDQPVMFKQEKATSSDPEFAAGGSVL